MKLKKSLSSMLLLSVVLGTVATPAVQAVETTVASTTADATTTLAPEAPTTSQAPATTVGPVATTESPVTTEVPATTSSSTTSPATTTAEDKESAKLHKDLESIEREFGIESNVLEGIVGRDDQYRIKNTKVNPYRKVVRLYMKYSDGTYVGSGTLIAPDLVLTAAHNVYNTSTRKWASKVVAVPGQNGNSTPYGTYTASNYFILRKYKMAGSNAAQFQQDVAVVKLSRKVSSKVGYLGVSTGGYTGQRVQVTGYPSYSASKSDYMYTMFGKLGRRDGNLFYYTIDTEGGQSGGPVLNNKNQVVGVHVLSHSYRYNRNKSDYNGARRVDGDVLYLIKQAKKGYYDRKVSSYKESSNTVYRLYHGGIKRHLYTKSLDEVSVLSERGWKYEGAKFKTATKGTAVYRLYHNGTREHLYTTSANERNTLRKRGWRYEGVAWYSTGKKPIYRLYHAGLKVHLYTADANEKNTLSKRGWKYEGVAFKVN